MNLLKSAVFVLLITIVWQSCKNEDQTLTSTYLELPSTPDSYQVGTSDYVPTLGRVLFYDNQLSINNSVSCSSCHKQAFAFADNVAFSRGFENRMTSRNSMPIQNINTGLFFNNTELFWDGREHNLQTMVLRPVANHVEMGIADLDKLAEKLSSISYYKDLFSNAYGSDEITSDKIANALSLFLQSIRSTNTKFDKVLQGNDQLSALELKGRQLFSEIYDCNACHQVENPSGYVFAGTFANIGLDKVYSDNGLQNVTSNPADAGKFKIPSLRNVVFTAPYMHDGRFATLEDVMEHYSTGIEDNPNLDFRLKSENGNGSPLQMHIPDSDKKAIIAFLNTLSDLNVVADQKFSSPFKTY